MIESSQAIADVQALLPIVGTFIAIAVALGLALAAWRYFKPGDSAQHASHFANDAIRIAAVGVACGVIVVSGAGKKLFDALGNNVFSYFTTSVAISRSGDDASENLTPTNDSYQVFQGQERQMHGDTWDNAIELRAEQGQEIADEITEVDQETASNEQRMQEISDTNENQLESNIEKAVATGDWSAIFDGIDTSEYTALKEENDSNFWTNIKNRLLWAMASASTTL